MALITLTRRYHFKAVHSLNTGVHRERKHGHHYALEVTMASDRLNLEFMDREVERLILAPLHAHELTGDITPATGEVLVNWIHSRLASSGKLVDGLVGVALQETRKNRFVSASTDSIYV